MCTAMTIKSGQGEILFGRTMDFSYPLDPYIYVMPKGYEWINTLKTSKIRNRYRFIGIGQEVSRITFADGFNEMGFAAAALYFPGYACYHEPDNRPDTDQICIAAIEMVNFLLGSCASILDVQNMAHMLRIVGTEDPITNTVAPLHWIVCDKSGKCMVIEQTESGLHLMDNPIGVLSNSPDFKWHMTNLRNYMNVEPEQSVNAQWGSVELTPFGQGAGTIGLPGDYTPPSRFVRTAYLKSHVNSTNTREEAVITCFHIMEGVTIPKGVVLTHRDTDDYTQYTAFMNISSGEYYYKTYHNSQIISVKLPSDDRYGSKPAALGKLIQPITFGSL